MGSNEVTTTTETKAPKNASSKVCRKYCFGKMKDAKAMKCSKRNAKGMRCDNKAAKESGKDRK